MSHAHVADALRAFHEERTLEEMHALGGPHPNTLRRWIQFERGDQPWKLTKGMLDKLTAAGAGLWPAGFNAHTEYERSDVLQQAEVDDRLADLIAARVVARLVRELRIDVRLDHSA